MYTELVSIYKRPQLFEIYTTDVLWTTPHIANNMLKFHLDPFEEAASRSKKFIDRSVQFIKQKFQLSKGTDVIDFGCGPGLYTSEFAKLGAKVTGIDFSANSLAYAKEKANENNLNIDYVQANYLTYEAGKQNDLATLIYCDYCAIDPCKRKTLLKVISSSLKNGGHFLLDVFTEFRFKGLKESHSFAYNEQGGFFSKRPHFLFTNEYQYKTELVSLDHFTIIEKNKIWDIYNWLQHFNKNSITEELEAAGFEVIEIFANVAGDSYYKESDVIAIICKKTSL